MTQPYSLVSSTSALSIRILSSRGALGRSYSSRLYFRKLHHALRMRRLTSMDRYSIIVPFFPMRDLTVQYLSKQNDTINLRLICIKIQKRLPRFRNPKSFHFISCRVRSFPSTVFLYHCRFVSVWRIPCTSTFFFRMVFSYLVTTRIIDPSNKISMRVA